MSFKSALTTTFLLLGLLLSGLVLAMKMLADARNTVAAVENRRYESYRLADQLRQSSEDLTRLARTHVATGDPRFKEWFYKIRAIRNGTEPRPLQYDRASWIWTLGQHENEPTGPPKSLEQLIQEQQFTDEECDMLREALHASDQLAQLEHEAMTVVEQNKLPSGVITPEGESPAAWALKRVLGEEYRTRKADIMRKIDAFFALQDARTMREVESARATEKAYLMTAWLIGTATIAACIASFFYLSRRVLLPVRQLATHAEDLTDGHYDRRAQVTGCTELESLAQSFNTMAGAIENDIAHRNRLEHNLELSKTDAEHAYQKIQSDLQAAAKVQQSLLPEIMPNIPSLSFAYTYMPCDTLGGDTLNVFDLDERHVALYLVDVSGHGVQSALLASSLSHMLAPVHQAHSLLWDYDAELNEYLIASPHTVAERLNKRFPLNPDISQYFTIHYGVLDTKTHRYRFISAGHPRPILVSRGKEPLLISAKGPAIGIQPSPTFEETELKLGSGDRLYFFSDGVLEAANAQGVPFQDAALFELLSTLHEVDLNSSLQRLLNNVQEWAGNVRLDDISAMALEVKATAS